MTRPVGVLALRIWRNEANQPRQGERQPRHRRLDRAGDLALLVDREARHRPDCDPFDLTDIDVRHKGKPVTRLSCLVGAVGFEPTNPSLVRRNPIVAGRRSLSPEVPVNWTGRRLVSP